MAPAQDLITLEQATSRTGRDFAAAYEGMVVKVRGQVSSSPIWALGTYYVPLRDSTDRGLILTGDITTFNDLAPGDWVEVEGKIESRGGLPLLVPTNFRKTGQEPPPRPKDLSVAELAGLRNLALMIRTTGVVDRVGENAGGQVLGITNQGYSITVFLPRAQTIQSERIASGLLKAREGDRVRVQGLSTQYSASPPFNKDFQVMLPSPEDVEIIESPGQFPLPALLGGVAALAAIVALWWFREKRVTAQRESWQAFYRLSEDLIVATAPEELAEKLSTALPSVIPATSASLYLFDRRTQALQRIRTSAEPEPMLVPLDNAPEGMAGGAVAAFRNRALLSVPDTRRNPLIKIGPKMNLPRSAMFVPLVSQDEVLGVLQADNATSVGYFSNDEQAATQHLANEAAASLRLQEQRAMREQVFRSEKLAATGQLISGVAAELRAPLENIAKLSEALSGLEDRPVSGTDIRGLYTESRRAQEIVSRLVSFGSANSESSGSADVNVILSGLVEFREPEWKGLGLRPQHRLVPAPIIVTGSQGQLEQLFLNLLLHAEHQAAASAKTLSIHSSILAGQAHVEIAYASPHDEQQPQPEVNPLTESLAVCLGIAKSYGGDIVYQNRSGAARFDVNLPLAPSDSHTPRERVDSSKPFRTLTVMIVDKDSGSQRQLLRMVGARSHRAVPVNPQEASELADRLRFDAVFWAARSGGTPWSESHDRMRNKISSFVLLSEGYDAELARSLEKTGGFLLSNPVQDPELERVLREIQVRSPAR
jgi:signal transduction histidine kinase